MSNYVQNPPLEEKARPVKRVSNWSLVYKRLRKNKAALIGGYFILFFFLVALFGPSLLDRYTEHDPYEMNLMDKFARPSAEHWFGTDSSGRDIFTRIIHGMPITLFVGFTSVLVGAIIGVPLGIISGYYMGKIDTVIMRIIDILLAFPGLLLAIALVSVLGGSLQNVIIAIGIFSVPSFARIVRGSTMSVRKLEYIDAIKALGASDIRIIFKHILPNIMSPIIVQSTLRIATAVLSASGLSFLGLGAQPPTPEWGAMLSARSRPYL